jgi:hypothetical protein
LRRGERPVTLEGQLRSFLAVPDSVIAVARNVELLHRLDAAFFRVGEARGGVLVKYHAGEPQASEDDLRAELWRHGLEVTSLEREGRFRFAYEPGEGDRAHTLRRLLGEKAAGGRSLWASFNWMEQVDLEEAQRQQEALQARLGWPAGGQHGGPRRHGGDVDPESAAQGAEDALGRYMAHREVPGPQPGDAAPDELRRGAYPGTR